MDVISSAANSVSLATAIAANGRQIAVHPWPDLWIEPWVATLGAKDDVKDDLAEGLRHARGWDRITSFEPTGPTL